MPTSGDLKVAIIQMCSVDDLSINIKNITKLLSQTPEGADLVLLPENCTYIRINPHEPPEKGFIPITHKVFNELQAIVDKKGFCLHMGGVPILLEGASYNASLWLQPKKALEVVYKKIHLFDVNVQGQKITESKIYTPGKAPAVIKLKGWSLGLSICYDLRFSELYLHYAKAHVDAVLVPAAFLVATGRAHWHTLLRARAIEGQFYVLAAAQCGEHVSQQAGGLKRSSYGHSLAVDPWGEILVDLANNAFGVQCVELSKNNISTVRGQIPMSNHRRL